MESEESVDADDDFLDDGELEPALWLVTGDGGGRGGP